MALTWVSQLFTRITADRPGGRKDAETAKPREDDPRHGTAGSPVRDPIMAGWYFLAYDKGRKRPPSSSEDSWNMAPWGSRSSTEGGRREEGSQDGGGHIEFEGEDRSPASRASSSSWGCGGIEEKVDIEDEGCQASHRRATRGTGSRDPPEAREDHLVPRAEITIAA